jgi:hypothetical protein
MAIALLRGMRWAAAPIAGALAALVVQFAVYHTTLELLNVQSGEGMWAAKAFTSLFMGAAFVAVVWWVAPAEKVRTATVAVVAVVVWGGRLIAGGVGDGGSAWLVAMGTLGILGGMVALWTARRSLKVEA